VKRSADVGVARVLMSGAFHQSRKRRYR